MCLPPEKLERLKQSIDLPQALPEKRARVLNWAATLHTTKLYGAPGCDETAVILSSFQNVKSSLHHSRLQRFPTLPQIREEIELRGEWTQAAC